MVTNGVLRRGAQVARDPRRHGDLHDDDRLAQALPGRRARGRRRLRVRSPSRELRRREGRRRARGVRDARGRADVARRAAVSLLSRPTGRGRCACSPPASAWARSGMPAVRSRFAAPDARRGSLARLRRRRASRQRRCRAGRPARAGSSGDVAASHVRRSAERVSQSPSPQSQAAFANSGSAASARATARGRRARSRRRLAPASDRALLERALPGAADYRSPRWRAATSASSPASCTSPRRTR